MLFREQTRVRLSEVSEHLGVAHSTAHRLLATLLPDLLAELSEIRERGYALNTKESEDGVASVAVPILGRNDAPLAALTPEMCALRALIGSKVVPLIDLARLG